MDEIRWKDRFHGGEGGRQGGRRKGERGGARVRQTGARRAVYV